MQDIAASLIAFFLIEPLKAEMTETLSAASAPAAIVHQITACANSAAPNLAARAAGDPWWAATSALNMWAGLERPEAILLTAAPGCAPAVEAARPFLSGERAS